MIKKRSVLGALDIGSQHLTFLLGEATSSQFNLLGYAQIPSSGIRKAHIEDLKSLTQSLNQLFGSLSKKVGLLPNELYLSQSGSQLKNIAYETALSLPGLQHIISEQDLKTINQLALQKELPPYTASLHYFRQFYSIDNKQIKNPLHCPANQFSVNYICLFSSIQSIKAQLDAVNLFGFKVKGLVFSGLASALATTSEMEREAGVCVIDIGASMTEFIGYKHQIPFSIGIIPVGGQNFTYDLCSGLRLHVDDAERLKREHGIPILREDTDETDIWALKEHSIGDKKVKIKNLHTILYVRAQEMFHYIHALIQKQNPNVSLLSGIVLTGGGALLKNIEKIAAETFHCDCYVRGTLASVKGDLKDPSYATCFGLLYHALQSIDVPKNKISFLQRITSWIKKT